MYGCYGGEVVLGEKDMPFCLEQVHEGVRWATEMRCLRSAVIASVLGVITAGCRDPKVALVTGPREYVASDYPQILERWTRTRRLISVQELDDLLTVSATYESWDFRWAYVVRYAQDYRLTVAQRRSLLDTTLQETQTRHQFFVALYGNNRRWTDLTRPNSAWIVRLIDDEGNETAPIKLELVPKPTALERTYFPYTSVWRQAFRIAFPRYASDGHPTIGSDAKWFGLRFAGAEGNQELRWDVEQARPASGSKDQPTATR